jgi:hypothetical protein
VVDRYALMAPKVGMTFDCEEKTYEMYNNYAGLVGFNTRKIGRSIAKMKVYVRNILFAVAKDVAKMRRHKRILQGPVVMLVFSLVSVRRMYGLCKKLC